MECRRALFVTLLLALAAQVCYTQFSAPTAKAATANDLTAHHDFVEVTSSSAEDSDPYVDYMLSRDFPPTAPSDPVPWGPMAKALRERVQERLRRFPPDEPILNRLCRLRYGWKCGGGECVPQSEGSRDIAFNSTDKRYYDAQGVPCGPLVYTDLGRRAPSTYRIGRVILRHATSTAYLDQYWEGIINGAAFADRHNSVQLVGMIPAGEHDNAHRFPRGAFFVKSMCVHAAFCLSPRVKTVILVDNDAFFTPEAFALRLGTEPMLNTFFPADKAWSLAFQDDMPFDELNAGVFAIRRTSATVDFLAAWWHEGVAMPQAPEYAAHGFANYTDGCCWYHPYDQTCMIVTVLRKLNGHNGFQSNMTCVHARNGTAWQPTVALSKGIPAGWREAAARTRVVSTYERENTWIRDGVDVLKDTPQKTNLFWNHPKKWRFPGNDKWNDDGMRPMVPSFLSSYTWPDVLFVRWNTTLRFQVGLFAISSTPFPHPRSVILHTGGKRFRFVRHDVPFSEDGRTPPAWAAQAQNLSAPKPQLINVVPPAARRRRRRR
eukprot:Rhum_TRINITY_DN19148_c0_g1::Rhum_TRINITY_DN19148_c0_g1_i1::g.169378::m.169378